MWAITSVVIILLPPMAVFAWGDNYADPETGEKGRLSYTIEEINNGAIGATPISDGEDYKNSDNYPGQIIFMVFLLVWFFVEGCCLAADICCQTDCPPIIYRDIFFAKRMLVYLKSFKISVSFSMILPFW